MKRILVIVCMIAALFCLGGCNMEISLEIKADGTVKSDAKYYVSLDDYKAISSMLGSVSEAGSIQLPEINKLEDLKALMEQKLGKELTVKKVGGVEMLVVPESAFDSKINSTDLFEGAELTPQKFYAKLNDDSVSASDYSGIIDIPDAAMKSIEKMIQATYVVKMPYEIEKTNGKVAADGKTVTFTVDSKFSDDAIYAYTKAPDTKNDAEKSKISVSGVKGSYIVKSKIKVTADEKIKSFKLNGKKQTKYSVKITKDGKYKVVVKTADETFKKTYIRDTKAPTVKGVSDGKTYKKTVTINFSDATSGIKSATLNGKKISSGKKVKKSGTYTLVVTDKAGNKKTVKFTIKK